VIQGNYLAIPGIISNILLFLTLLSPILKGVTFIFLRFIAFVQIIQGLSIVLSLFFEYGIRANVWLVTTPLFDSTNFAAKLTVSMATLFMTLERFVAVCLVSKHAPFKTKKFYFISFSVSILVGLLEYESTMEQRIVSRVNSDNITNYHFEDNDFGKFHSLRDYVNYLMIVIRLMIVILLTIMGTAVAVAIYRRGKRMKAMMGSDASVQEHKEMLALCRFQTIDTIAMAIETLISVAGTLSTVTFDMSIKAKVVCSFEETLWKYRIEQVWKFLELISIFCYSMAHLELFFIYLIFFGKFRKAFIGNWKIFFGFFRKGFLVVMNQNNKVQSIGKTNQQSGALGASQNRF
jgi:hypothetical protein